MLIGGVTIASIQLLAIYLTKMDVVNIVSFTVIQYLYMDLIKAIFDIKMEKLAEENSGN